MISSGFQSAITVFVGQNFGAREYKRIKRSIWDISGILVPYALVISLLLLFIPETLLRIFIDDDLSVSYGIRYLQIISISQIPMIIEGIGAGFFNGIGKSYIPSVVGIFGNSLRIPFVIWLTKDLLEEGIWWSLNISTIFKALLIIIAFIYIISRLDDMKMNQVISKRRKAIAI